MRTRPVALPLASGLIAAAVVLLSPPAWANEEESDESALLVQQAISLLANENTPEMVLERIEDAREAPITEGVDLALVSRAAALVAPVARQNKQVLPDGVKAQVRRLLEQSVGSPEASAPADMATGIETGTRLVLDEYRPARGVSDRGDAVLLTLSALAILLGLVLAHRLRPHHTLRQLRQAHPSAASEEQSA